MGVQPEIKSISQRVCAPLTLVSCVEGIHSRDQKKEIQGGYFLRSEKLK